MIATPVNHAFSRLEVTQEQLVSALSAFHDACSQLYTTAVEMNYRGDIYGDLDDRLTRLSNQLDSLSATEEKLGQSHSFLRRTRNISKTMIRINRLPPELLASIFEFAASDQDGSGTVGTEAQAHPLVAIPSVCVSWRQLALCSPRLWTNIDLSQCYKPSMMARAISWFRRAREVPLHLQFAHHRFFDDEDLDPEFKHVLTRAVSFDISASDETYVQDLFNHYDQLGGSNKLRTITMAPHLWPGKLSDHFNWSRFVPDTLTTLKLVNTSGELTPTLDELVLLLSRTHNLRTLILRDVNVTTGSPCTSDTKVHLPNLEYLESYPHRNTRPNYLGVTKQLMRSIVPGSNGIEAWLEMGEPDDEDHDTSMQKFFLRSRITRLHTGYFKPHDQLTLARHLDSLPELESLNLDFDSQATNDILSALVVSVDGQAHSARCPKLRELRLSEACITPQSKEQLKQVVEIYDLTKLIFGDRAYFVDESDSPIEDDETMEWLSEQVEDFDYVSGVSWFGLAA